MRSFIASAFVIAIVLIGQQAVVKSSKAASLPFSAVTMVE